MRMRKSKVYEFYAIVKDIRMGDLPTQSFVKMLKNINRAREVCQEIDAGREEASNRAVTDEVREAGGKIDRHNVAIKLKMNGEDYDAADILGSSELVACVEAQNKAMEKLGAYERSWRDEEVEIEIAKIPEEDLVKYASGATRKEGDKEVKLTNDQAALLYELLV